MNNTNTPVSSPLPHQPPTQPSLNDPLKPVLPPAAPKKEKHSPLRSFVSTFLLIGGALVFALFINTFVFQSYEVDGSSMEPTLHNKDRLIIWKLPRTWARITGNDYTPKRGDIVVFHKPDGSSEQLIKRVIGLPGDRVVVGNGKITIYNDEHPEGFEPDDAPYGEDLVAVSDSMETNVKEGEVFVSGDNRAPGASLDSRTSLGNIPLKYMVGKLVLRLYPFQDFDTY